jgi:restriction endonuclease S subunit
MKVRITDISDINIGYQFREKIEPTLDGTYPLIQIRDFDEHRLLNTGGLLRVEIDKPADQYRIRKGDVLFLSRGQKNWATPIAYDLNNAIAVSHFFVLKIKSTAVLPEYLAWYLNQAPVQEYLHSNARHGTHMPLVPMSAFKGLEVEVPSIDKQRNIVELSKLMEKEKQLLAELQEKRTRLIGAVCLKAAKSKKEKAK